MPAARVQLAEVGLKVPVELVVKLRDPEGVVAPVADVSVTVVVQLVGVLTWTGAGEH